MSDQPRLPFDQPRKRRPRATKQLPPKPPPRIHVRAWRAVTRWLYRTWLGVRWALRHAGEIKAAVWYGSIAFALVLAIGGVAYFDIDFGGGYRLRLYQTQPAPAKSSLPVQAPLTGWNAQIKPPI